MPWAFVTVKLPPMNSNSPGKPDSDKIPVLMEKVPKLPVIETVSAFPFAGVPVTVPLIKFPLEILVGSMLVASMLLA